MPTSVSAEKAAVVAEVSSKLTAADAALVTEYRGMTVFALAKLRRALRAQGAEHHVYKNTLARFGAKQAGYEGLADMLVGPSAITFVSGDPSAVAKTLRDFSKENPLLILKGGVIAGKPVDAAAVKALADLPSREVLLSMFAGALKAPLSKTANLLQAPMRRVAYGLKALVDSKGA
jgi:large subunit ribosomal protein L10